MSPDRSPQRRADAPLPLAPRPLRRTARLGALFAAFGLGLGALVVAPDAEAQVPKKARVQGDSGDGLDDHLFRPALDSKGFFSVNGADILGSGDVSFGLVIDYGHGLMEMNEGYGSDYLVEHAFQGTFHFDYGIGNLAVVGISAPVVLNAGDTATGIGPTGATYDDDKLDAQALGQFSAHGKIRILRPDGPLGLALLVQVGTEVAGADDLAAEPGFFYWPQLALEKRFGASQAFRLGLNAGYRGHTGKNAAFGLGANGEPQLVSGVLEYSNLITGNFGMSYRVFTPLDLVAETYITQQAGGGSDSKQKLSAEAIGGIKLFIERSSFLMIGGGVGYTNGFQAADQRGVLGFVFEPSIGDRDGDGIKDDLDDCPDDPEDFDGFQDTKEDSPPGKYGCPDPDNDNDGILDVDDRCPNNPEDRDGDHDDDGCPEGSDGDRDGDGILDSRDKCPDDPEDRDGFQDKDGCPDPDNDEDGILDKVDLCPNDPEDKDGFEDENGCPDPDNDRDTILDVVDKCPMEPEVFNGSEDEDGCPDEGRVIVSDNNVLILDKINFKTGSAEILPDSFPIIDAVSSTLTHHPEFTLIEVQGHADERAADDYNLRLTQDRANAVLEALSKKGVERERMRAMGYGEYCPIDTTKTPVGFEKNRRVEFKILKTKQGPTGVELGCEKAKDKGVVAPPVP